MKKIADIVAYVFILSVAFLSIISILGVWEVFTKDVISKSFQSIALLAVVSAIVLLADRFIDSKKEAPAEMGTGSAVVEISQSSGFTVIRHVTLVLVIVSVVVLALLGLLSIWEVIAGTVVTKSITSIAIIAFSSFVVVLVSLERENHKLLRGKNQQIPVGNVIFLFFVIWVFMSIVGLFSGF